MSTTMPTELVGVVLSGGASSRMGQDKGLLAKQGLPWAARAVSLLQHHTDRVVVSIRPEQQLSYAAAMPAASFVSDVFPDMGPLGGLLSVHQKFPLADLFLLACDMVSIEAADIERVLEYRGRLAAYKWQGHFEPLCALYPAATCAAMLQTTGVALNQGNRPPGLQQLLQTLRAIALNPLLPARLQSQNTPVVV